MLFNIYHIKVKWHVFLLPFEFIFGYLNVEVHIFIYSGGHVQGGAQNHLEGMRPPVSFWLMIGPRLPRDHLYFFAPLELFHPV